MRASGTGHLSVCDLLIRSGADGLLADGDGENALHKAAANGHAEVR